MGAEATETKCRWTLVGKQEHNLQRNLLQGITKAMTNPRLYVGLNCVNEAISYASRELYPKEYWKKQNSPVRETSHLEGW